MNPHSHGHRPAGAGDPDRSAELPALIATLHETLARLDEITAGQVDSISDTRGGNFLLQRAQDALRMTDANRQAAILDTLPLHIALIDHAGTILSVNHAWNVFAAANSGQHHDFGVGCNYLDTCDRAIGANAAEAGPAGDGIRSILDGRASAFTLEYPCHSPTIERWFQMTVNPVLTGASIGAVIMHRDISSRRVARVKLQESELRFRQLAENIPEVFFLREPDGLGLLYVSPAYQEIWGRTVESLYAEPSAWLAAVHEDDRARTIESLTAGGSHEYQVDYRIVRPDGSIRWIHARQYPVFDEAGTLVRLAGVASDITEQKQATELLRANQQRLAYLNRVHSILGAINSLIVRVRDREELFTEACRIAVDAGGFRMAMIGSHNPVTGAFDTVASAGKDSELLNEVRDILTAKARVTTSMVGTAISEKRIVVANDSRRDPRLLFGARYAEAGVRSLAVFPLVVADAVVGIFALYASEIEFFHGEELKLLTELSGDIAFAIDYIEKSRRLDYLAFYDALTGLPNANLFRDRLDKFIQGVRPDHGEVCVVVIDIERFTLINDNLGRSAGDELLRAMGVRLEQFLVEPFALARIAADTYAVASPGDHEPAPTRIIDCIHRALEQSFSVATHSVNVAVQAGIALFPADGEDGEAVFKNAEAALKRGKESGTRTTYHSHALNSRVAERYALEQELHAAIRTGQFILHYQRRIDMISGELVGAEALIRWQHPTRGLVAPDDFIGLAEETGLITEIGAWVLKTVCAQQSAWSSAGVSVVPIGVNLSSIQFGDGKLVESVSAALAAHRIDPRLLILELTESAVMKDPAGAAVALHALRKIGVGLALDDFGTGYSSLAHLKRFPFDSVKIDRSFIADITSNPEDAAIATAIIAMAHGLRLKVVAEGVETQGQFNYLRSKSCDEMQGFLFGPAVAMEEFESQLRSSRRLSLPALEPADRRTLLIVDDEQGIRSSLVRMLRSDGYRILQADTGQAGLDLLALNDVQVIISDQRMPGMTGTEFLNAVSRLYPSTVRMILSGFTDLKVVTDSVNRGSVFKFLTKPWDDDELREQVRDAFRRHRAQ